MTGFIEDVKERLRTGRIIYGFHPEHFKVIRDLILASDSYRILIGKQMGGYLVDLQTFPTKDAVAVTYGDGRVPGVGHFVAVGYRDGQRQVVYRGDCVSCTLGKGHITVAREICRLPPFDGQSDEQLAVKARLEEGGAECNQDSSTQESLCSTPADSQGTNPREGSFDRRGVKVGGSPAMPGA